jgi:hypothetical protein
LEVVPHQGQEKFLSPTMEYFSSRESPNFLKRH